MSIFARLASAALVATLLASPVPAADQITVIDGDTVEWQGKRIRLLDFDAPEIHHAQCEQERRLGHAASFRLQFLLAGSVAEIELSGRLDRYGRELGRIRVGGRDVGDILIGEGLARRYTGGRRKGWCGS